MKCLVCYHDMVERKVTLDLRIGEHLYSHRGGAGHSV